MSEVASEQICFVIAPIGDADTPTRKRSDQVLRHIIIPVTKELGYTAIRADNISETGVITLQVLLNVLNADLVVADLSDRNPNVFYELGVRHVTGKPTIQLVQADEQIPFDVAGIRAIKYDLSDLDKVDAARDELRKQIEAFEQNPRTETPVSQAVNLQALQQGKNPLETGIADITVTLEGISRDIHALQRQIAAQGLSRFIGQLRIKTFSGVGPGTYNHGFRVKPDSIFLQVEGQGITGYDSLGITSVRVIVPDGTPFVGVAIKFQPRTISQQLITTIKGLEVLPYLVGHERTNSSPTDTSSQESMDED